MPIPTVIPHVITDRPADQDGFRRAAAAYGDQVPVRARVTSSGTGLTRTITIRAVNQQGCECIGVYALLVVIGTTAAGGPAGTQTVGALSAGTIIHTLSAHQAYILMTDSAGRVVFPVTQSGSWSARYVRAAVWGVCDGTDAVA